MKVGDRVKWAQPLSPQESLERFHLIEVNGDRCFIRFICDLAIPPVQVAKIADLALDNSEVSDERTSR